jgi:RHS repeat-associated protein
MFGNDTYTFDDDGLLTQAGALALTRSATTGQLTDATLGVVASTWSYGSYGALETATAKVSGTTVFQEMLTRDALDRVTAKVESVQGVTTNWTYSYDTAGRLQQVKKNGVIAGTYDFDANGNRTSANGAAATFDAQDRLLTSGTLQFKHDAFGSLIEKRDAATVPNKVTQYQHDGNGGLRKATLPDGTALDYLVDARGRRVGKKRNGVLEKGWLYDGQLRIVAELNGSGAVVGHFVYGTTSHSPDYLIRGGVVYRFIHDPLGSVRLVINSTTGVVAQHIDYDEWGNVLADSAPGFQPFGFAGGLYDRDLKLARFGARDYDPAVGRWTTKDPIGLGGGDTNVYAYSNNDPTDVIDPTGLNSVTARVWVMIAQGDIAGAGEYYLLATGASQLPRWFQAMQAAFSAANRVAGPCQRVANDIYNGFQKLGQNPTFVNFSTGSAKGSAGRIGFEQGGQWTMVSTGGTHVAVQVGSKIYDAFTGPAGMTLADYTSRLVSGMQSFPVKIVQ